MALDSRPRPVRRPARRRVPLLTALALLMMAAGLWFTGPPAVSVPAPRLHVAEAQIAAAERAIGDEPAARPPVEEATPVPVVAAAPVVVPFPAAPVAVVSPAVAGPRAPPHR